ncbi:MAG: hypothetical protein H6619_01610 [Deltaproteobacteria bacterium]|nr:hypothetical protein [Deltaproteobacteria bacterium]
MKPIIRFCVKHQMNLQDLLEASKSVFLEVAEEELTSKGEKINMSRLSAITGVHRKDTARIYKNGERRDPTGNITSRVIGLWRELPEYTTKNKRPRTLTFKGEDSEFTKLVAAASTDIRPGAILFALEQLDAVEKTKTGLKLKAAAYVPRNNPAEGIRLVSEDVEDLMDAVFENIESQEEELPNYHAKSIYDNISKDDVPKIRKWFMKQCSQFQSKVEKYLAQHDLDINPQPEKEGGERVVLGIFTKT